MKRAEQLRKQLADAEAEVARLEMAEIVYQQYQEDAEAGAYIFECHTCPGRPTDHRFGILLTHHQAKCHHLKE